VITESQLESVLVTEGRTPQPRGQVTLHVLKAGTDWSIKSHARVGTATDNAIAGLGWIANEPSGRPWFAATNLTAFNSKLIEETCAELLDASSAGLTNAADRLAEDNYRVKLDQAKRLEAKGQSELDGRLRGLTFSIIMEPYNAAEEHDGIQTQLEVTPNVKRRIIKVLAPLGISPKYKESKVTYGGLHLGSGTLVNATLSPLDKLTTGSEADAKPDWWKDMLNEPGIDKTWISNNLRQGHLLNHLVGGPGTDMKNLVPFSASANGQHSWGIERKLKEAVNVDKSSVLYQAFADYATSPDAAAFKHQVPIKYLQKFPRKVLFILRAFRSRPPHDEYITASIIVINSALLR
jgi:hypothetical protein